MVSQQDSLDALSVEHLQADLKGRSIRGGVLSLGAQGANFLLQSVATVTLARLLTPVDFGLVAMVTAVTAIAAGFADLGLTEATIQRKDITHNQVSTLFWINVGIGLLFTLTTAAMAPILAWFYKEPALLNITLAVSLNFLFGGLRGQHTAILKRQMRFRALAIRDVVSYVIAVPVAIIMAWHGAGYWAIVALPLVLNSTQMVLTWMMVGWTPGLPRFDSEIRSLVSFGGGVAASYVIFNWFRNADNVLIGWYWGAGPLGLYSRAYSLLLLPISQLIAPVSNVAVPAFSRVQDDPELFAKYYLRVVNLLMWISAPLFGFLFVAAQPVIVLTLGGKWRLAAPIFQILAISALGQVLLESTLWLFVSRGQSKQLLGLLSVVSSIIVVSFIIGLPFGTKQVALSFSIILLTILPWIFRFTFRGTNLTLQRLGQALVCPVSLCLFGVLLAEIATYLINPQHTFSQLAVTALGFIVAYSASALIPAAVNEIMSFRKLVSELRPSDQTVQFPTR